MYNFTKSVGAWSQLVLVRTLCVLWEVDQMTLQQLHYAVEVAKYSSVNAAAKSLYVSQPTLSKAISNLEKELGIAIFQRTQNGITLTGNGVEFIQQARAVLNEFNQISLFYEKKKSSASSIHVTSGRHTFVTAALVDFCNTFIQDSSEVEVVIHEKAPQKIYKDILDNVADIGMVCLCKNSVNFWKEFFEYHSIHFELLFTCQESLILREDHPLLTQGELTFERLKEYPVVQSFEPNTDFPNFDTEIELLKYKEFPKIIRTGERSIIYGLLQTTDAFFLATTDICVSDFFPGLVSRPLPPPLPLIEWGHYVIYRKDKNLTQIERRFIENMRSICQHYSTCHAEA